MRFLCRLFGHGRVRLACESSDPEYSFYICVRCGTRWPALKLFGVEVIEDARVPVGEIRLGSWDGPVLIENLAPPAEKRSLEDSLTGAQKLSGEPESA